MTAEPPRPDEARRCARFAWPALAAWATLGLGLEAAHAFKLASYLDDGMRRLLLRLGHAHGVVLALVVLAFGASATALYPDDARAARLSGRLLRAGALLIPLGFALSAVRPGESDPGLPIVLVPVGALALLSGLVRIAIRAFRV
jgi:hypothetical protein